MKLLLHTCCGPCFLGVWEELGTHGDIETTLYYFNPNIYPEDEWLRRRDNLKVVTKEKDVVLIGTEYGPGKYSEVILSFGAKGPGLDSSCARNDGGGLSTVIRCPVCYRLRLEETARYAKENGFDAISTTLFVSPYQQHETLKEVIADVAAHYGVDFYYTDWRPYFRDGQNEAKALEIYRQRYCGCKYSRQESGK